MKKLNQTHIKSTIFLTLFLFIISCQSQEEKLKEVGFWKYADGFHKGDVLDFNSQNFKLKDDTIYRNDSAVAILKNVKSIPFINHQEITIEDLNSGETGRYIGK